jgi:hypothetical protein
MGQGFRVAAFGVMLLLTQSEARACDASGWLVQQHQDACITLGLKGDATVQVVNGCNETVTLTSTACSSDCPSPVEIAPGDSQDLTLPMNPGDEQEVAFSATHGNVESALTFVYQENRCLDDKASGCHIGRARSSSYAGDTLLLVLVALGLRRTSPRKRARH